MWAAMGHVRTYVHVWHFVRTVVCILWMLKSALPTVVRIMDFTSSPSVVYILSDNAVRTGGHCNFCIHFLYAIVVYSFLSDNVLRLLNLWLYIVTKCLSCEAAYSIFVLTYIFSNVQYVLWYLWVTSALDNHQARWSYVYLVLALCIPLAVCSMVHSIQLSAVSYS
jgi:hypothetical protein